jgi:hypothetical protein
MSILLVLMCLKGMEPCDASNAALVIRQTMTNAECESKVDALIPQVKAGVYTHPPGGWYVFDCQPMEPRA